HAAAAFQGVKGTAHVDERIMILWVLVPQWEEPIEVCDLFLGFFDEQLEKLGIELPIRRLHDGWGCAGLCGRRRLGRRLALTRRGSEYDCALVLRRRGNGLRQWLDDQRARMVG